MGCANCDFKKITPYKPYEEDIIIPKDADLVLKIQGKQEGIEIDWDSGTLNMRVLEHQDDDIPILEFQDSRFGRSQSESAEEDVNVTWDDVVALLVKNSNELQDLELGWAYWFVITFHHTSLDIQLPIWRAWLTRDYK